jgi:hypothetical protein
MLPADNWEILARRQTAQPLKVDGSKIDVGDLKTETMRRKKSPSYRHHATFNGGARREGVINPLSLYL